MKRILLLLLIVGMSLGIWFFTQKNPLQHFIYEGFDTWIEIDIPSRQRQVALVIEAVINEYDKRWDRFSPESEIWKINHDHHPVEVNMVTLDILVEARRFHTMTEGYYNVFIGSLMDEWGFADHPRLPSPDRLHRLTEQIAGSDIEINEERKTVRRLGEGTIDLGGIAKGYLVDMMVDECKKHRITHALINAGGTVYALGKAFRVGILHPRHSSIIGVIEVKDQAVSTSGDYFRYFEDDGVRYYHILNPFTGYPEHDFSSVTIVYPHATEADVISTAVMAGGCLLIPFIEKRFPGVAIIAIRSNSEIFLNEAARSMFQPLPTEIPNP